MTFQEIERRLVHLLNEKVRRGEISQRQLARLTGFTQPHIHNVLKGARAMQTQLADAVLACLDLSVSDLIENGNTGRQEKIPLCDGELGPRRPVPERLDDSTFLLFSEAFVSRFVQPVLVRVALDEDAMSPLIEPGDIVLVDRAEWRRRRPVFDSICVVEVDGQGGLCRCRQVGNSLVLVADNARRAPRFPERVSLATRSILDVVRGTVVWTCREFNSGQAATLHFSLP
ncbi:MAG TPA: hypothetical protein VFA54_08225 [Bryobacterales bacterium]|jgi:predicted XRE-type DNA-binding protein|nr:hypothetical protein [Bryobacterales bacterium]